ncbi:glycosyltransferase [Sulfitobacter sp. SH24]|uniref:glycosyltransferase n=1 Tax=Sulfitobacter sp. SH24 TaxID=3421173 RepID=UPI003F4FECF1|tara:strand:+ start:2739 stop:3743 length:1005 start_codon:yes stop_codon:yes gene_type:complete
MTQIKIIHLVDDTTAGGVMRVLDYITTTPELAKHAKHGFHKVARDRWLPKKIRAEVIVSNLAISWRAMPMLIALRLMHPKAKLIHVEHSYTEHFVALNVIRKKRFAALLRHAYGLFDQIVAVSYGQAEWLIRSGAVKSEKLTVIQSCVDLSGFRNLEPPKGPPYVIGAIGRLEKQKGFDLLIEAFRQTTNPNIALHFYGEGHEEADLRRLAGDDPRICFKGFAQDPVAAMAKVSIVAIPSQWEAYGLVAIEALAAGRQLLVSNVDGLKDHLAIGAKAVEPHDVNGWRDAIDRATEQGNIDHNNLNTKDKNLECTYISAWSALIEGPHRSTALGK